MWVKEDLWRPDDADVLVVAPSNRWRLIRSEIEAGRYPNVDPFRESIRLVRPFAALYGMRVSRYVQDVPATLAVDERYNLWVQDVLLCRIRPPKVA
jgi:hypothetical protein